MSVNLEALIDGAGSWDWANSHVSNSFNDPATGQPKKIAISDIVESGTVLIAAGPADFDDAMQKSAVSGANSACVKVVPIGLVESAQIGMNKPLSRIFEIGSMLSYIIPGRTVGGISLSRVFFDGPSLLKAIYMGEVTDDVADQQNKYSKFASNGKLDSAGTTTLFEQSALIGSGNLAVNLASSFFDHPVGLAFFFRDQKNSNVSEIYFEGCSVGSYNLGISANMNVLTEAISIEFIRCRPIVTRATWDSAGDGKLADNSISGPGNSVTATPTNLTNS